MPAMGGIMGGMEKTTVYLTAEQKGALARAAQEQGRSEAHLIREGIAAVTARQRIAEIAAPFADAGRNDALDRDPDVTHRPRWMASDEFVRRVVGHPADAGLRAELLALAPDTTDEADPG